MRRDHGGRAHALHRNGTDEYHCTDGLCTQERVHLAGGRVEVDLPA